MPLRDTYFFNEILLKLKIVIEDKKRESDGNKHPAKILVLTASKNDCDSLRLFGVSYILNLRPQNF